MDDYFRRYRADRHSRTREHSVFMLSAEVPLLTEKQHQIPGCLPVMDSPPIATPLKFVEAASSCQSSVLQSCPSPVGHLRATHVSRAGVVG
jgi:hypothetical protein